MFPHSTSVTSYSAILQEQATKPRLITSACFAIAMLIPLMSFSSSEWCARAAVSEKELSAEELLADADARIAEYRKADAVVHVIDAGGKSVAGAEVDIQQLAHEFLFGSNIFMWGRFTDKAREHAYRARFAELLNYATVPFYWWAYEPQRGRPHYAQTSRLVQWCASHGIVVKGHPLLWNWSEPKWLPADIEQVRMLQMQRVFDCVKHFRGKIQRWDVVNEATHFDRRGLAGVKLTAAWKATGKATFARQAFVQARRANPGAILLINDYRTDDAYEQLIRQLVDSTGRRLYDAIGIQSHMHGGPWPLEKLWQVCQRFGRFGVPLHFTEVTVLSGRSGWNRPKPWPSTPQGEQRQAEYVAKLYTLLFSHPAVEAITWWDFSDAGAWQGAPAGLLRGDCTPKPAYERLKKLIKGKWWTRAKLRTDDEGLVRFRGFRGRYALKVRRGELEGVTTFTLTKRGKNRITVRVSHATHRRTTLQKQETPLR